MTSIEQIRAALEILRAQGMIGAALDGLDALAELEKSSSRSSARMSWEICGCQTQPTHYVGTMPCPLNTTPPPAKPAPLGPALGLVEIREPTPEECERIHAEMARLGRREGTSFGRDALDAMIAVMWPREGL